jgi:hypothetical protein
LDANIQAELIERFESGIGSIHVPERSAESFTKLLDLFPDVRVLKELFE